MAFNRGFLSLLHGRLREWAPQQCIGDIFLGMVQIYTQTCTYLCTNIHVIFIIMFSLNESYSILVIDLGGINGLFIIINRYIEACFMWCMVVILFSLSSVHSDKAEYVRYILQ